TGACSARRSAGARASAPPRAARPAPQSDRRWRAGSVRGRSWLEVLFQEKAFELAADDELAIGEGRSKQGEPLGGFALGELLKEPQIEDLHPRGRQPLAEAVDEQPGVRGVLP